MDASAAVLGLLDEGAARSRLAADHLAAPHLIDVEVTQAIRATVLRGDVLAADGSRAIERWARLGIRRFAVTGLLGRIWQLRSNLSAYDAGYVALAEALDRPLLTADARLAAAPGPACQITVVRT